jgi:hypothetical protein
MGATLHWTSAQIRLGSEHHVYGDPYQAIITVQRIGDTAHLSGGCGVMPRKGQRDVLRLLKDAGIKRLVWERIKDGQRKPVEVSLTRASRR